MYLFKKKIYNLYFWLLSIFKSKYSSTNLNEYLYFDLKYRNFRLLVISWKCHFVIRLSRNGKKQKTKKQNRSGEKRLSNTILFTDENFIK